MDTHELETPSEINISSIEQKKHSLGKNRKLLIWAFVLSGMTALIYEVVWIRILKLVVGSTAFSLAIMFSTLFFGFAIGSYWFRKKVDSSSNTIHLLVLLEILLGGYGIGIIFFFKLLPSIVAPLGGFLKYLIIFLFLLAPAVIFGALWPVFSKLYVKTADTIGKDTGMLFFGNSMGGSFGALASGFILIPFLGLTFTSLLASAINLLIGLFFFFKKGEFEG